MPLAQARPWLAAALVLWSAACTAGTNSPASGSTGAGGQSAGTGGKGGAGGTSGAGLSGTGGDDAITVASSSSTGGSGTGGMGGQSCTAGAGGSSPQAEICDNGKDDDLDGFIDEGCSCQTGATQMCFPGTGDVCQCKVGQQTCIQAGEFGQWGPCVGAMMACAGPLNDVCEVCGNGVDDDCDGQIDEGCVIDLEVNINGDCVKATCPPQAPNPIGCNIVMQGNDPRGCVAHGAGSPEVYFQEGDNCGAGHVTGTLKCSSQPGDPLNSMNCPINKSQKFYPASSNGCP